MHEIGEASNYHMDVDDFINEPSNEVQLDSMQVACMVEEDRTWINI